MFPHIQVPVNGQKISIQNGKLVPLLFADIRDPRTGKTRVRNINPDSENFRVAREYMIRLDATDVAHEDTAEKLSRAGSISIEELQKRFG